MTLADDASGSLTLRFGSPEAGWLDVELRGPAGGSRLDVSDVPGDSLAMLADAAHDLVVGVSPRDVTWFLEPAEVVWRFRRDGDHVEVRAEHAPGRAQLIGIVTVTAFATLVLQALRTLALDPAWAHGDSTWSHDFPAEQVAALARCLQAPASADDA